MKYYDLDRDILEVERRVGVSLFAIFNMPPYYPEDRVGF